MLTERFGWTGPPDGKQGHYDYVSYIHKLSILFSYLLYIELIINLTLISIIHSSHWSSKQIRINRLRCLRYRWRLLHQCIFIILSIPSCHHLTCRKDRVCVVLLCVCMVCSIRRFGHFRILHLNLVCLYVIAFASCIY